MLNNNNEKDEKLYIVDELIKRFKASVVRQTMFSEFELNIHELEQNGEVLTKNLLCNEYYILFGTKGQIGREAVMSGVSIEYTERPSNKWVKNYSGKV